MELRFNCRIEASIVSLESKERLCSVLQAFELGARFGKRRKVLGMEVSNKERNLDRWKDIIGSTNTMDREIDPVGRAARLSVEGDI